MARMKKTIIAFAVLSALAFTVAAQDTKFSTALSRRGAVVARESYEMGWLRGAAKVKLSAEVVAVGSEPPVYAIVLDSLETDQSPAQAGIIDFDELPVLIGALDGIAKATANLKSDSRPLFELTYETRAGAMFGLSQARVMSGQEQQFVLRVNDRVGATVYHFPIDQMDVMRSLVTKAREKLILLGAK
jgi:hypothetical protein